MCEKDIVEIYKKHFPSILEKSLDDSVDEYVKEIYKVGMSEDVLKTKKDTVFVEKAIINYILSLENENQEVEYLSVSAKKMNSGTMKTDKLTIMFDELFQYTLMTFYYMIFSLIYDSSKENFKRCFKCCIVLLDLQGNKNEIGTYNSEELFEMCKLPSNVLDLAMDAYWMSWTFIFAHELYHTKNKSEVSTMQEELEADKFAYITLVRLILDQKNSKMPEDIEVFQEYLYLAPVMMMDYFELLDFYNSLFGKTKSYVSHPEPKIRQKRIFAMFDDYIPDSIDTEIGNDIYNNFLNQIEILKEQLEIKVKKGRLDFLSDI